LELTTNFISLDNLRQENFSLMASWLRAVEDLRFSLFPKVKGRFFASLYLKYTTVTDTNLYLTRQPPKH
jgi:hypothetical protein